jgi:hypothetical protein
MNRSRTQSRRPVVGFLPGDARAERRRWQLAELMKEMAVYDYMVELARAADQARVVELGERIKARLVYGRVVNPNAVVTALEAIREIYRARFGAR